MGRQHRRNLARGGGWEVNVTRRGLFKPLPTSKTKHFLDISFKAFAAIHARAAHGLIGQSFSRTEKRDGRVDNYTDAEVTTSAQAEGAIDGVHTDYELREPFQTDFKFSRFGKNFVPPSGGVAHVLSGGGGGSSSSSSTTGSSSSSGGGGGGSGSSALLLRTASTETNEAVMEQQAASTTVAA